jgi:hypothetical protein
MPGKERREKPNEHVPDRGYARRPAEPELEPGNQARIEAINAMKAGPAQEEPLLQSGDIPDTESLLKQAGQALGPFTNIFDHIVNKTDGVDVEKHLVTVKAKDGNGENKKTMNDRQILLKDEKSLTGMGNLKGPERIEEKILQKYQKHKQKNILDVVRGTIAYKDCTSMAVALGDLNQLVNEKGGTIVRAKQLYEVDRTNDDGAAMGGASEGAHVYGDIKISIKVPLKDEEGNTIDGTHICELQFNLTDVLTAKSSGDGHGAYENLRKLETEYLADHPGEKTLPKIENLSESDPEERVLKAKMTRIIHSSHSAYGHARRILDKDPGYELMMVAAENIGAQRPKLKE